MKFFNPPSLKELRRASAILLRRENEKAERKISEFIMEGLQSLLGKLSVEDIEKLKLLMSLMNEGNAREVVTIRVFADEYKTLIKNNRSAAYLRSVNIAFNYLEKFFKPQTAISNINLKDIENFLVYLQQNDKSGKYNRTRNGNGYVVYFRNLKAAFNKAKDWEYVKENYFLKIKLPKKQKTMPAFINIEQLSAICGQLKCKVVRDVVVFAFYTGMRLDEIVNLRWKNVNMINKIITVGDEEFITKGRNQRFIPICDEVSHILASRLKANTRNSSPLARVTGARRGDGNPPLPLQGGENLPLYPLPRGENNGYVFCKSNGQKYTGEYFTKRFKKACKAAGIDKAIHFHSLRHSFASNLVQQGVSLYKVKELLGHSSITTTEIYSHLNIDSLREAISKLDNPHPSLLPKGEGEKRLPGSLSNTSKLKLIINK